MRFVKTTGLLLILLLQTKSAHSQWMPRDMLKEPSSALKALEDPSLNDLTIRVQEALKDTWCSPEKAKLIMELVAIKPGVSVDIGAFTGHTTLPMLVALQHVGKGEAYVVEPWSKEETLRGLPAGDPNTQWWAGIDMNEMRAHFTHLMNHWSLGQSYKLLNMSSEDALALLPTIDFLHIDGNFSAEGALKDSELYVHKVVPGGYILISNVFMKIDGKFTKTKALWPLFEHCEIVCEIDNSNTLLFRKKANYNVE
jgi:hypothetical protein